MGEDHKSEVPDTTGGASDIEAMRAELARLRAEREALDAAGEAERLREQIERERRELEQERAIAAAEAKHGKLGVAIGAVKTRLGVVILRRPHVAAFRKFQEIAEPKMVDVEAFVRPHVLEPSRETFDRWNDELPALLVSCAKVLGTLAAGAATELAGKS